MDKNIGEGTTTEAATESEIVEQLLRALEEGRQWPEAVLEAMAVWTAPEDRYRERDFKYFIGGEAFDWLALVERLCLAAGDLIPKQEQEELLFTGRFPDYFDETTFRDLLGGDKYRAYLNFYYGVTVEEALQLAGEREVHKRLLSNGYQYEIDVSEEAFTNIYRAPRSTMLDRFRRDVGYADERSMGLTEAKEFTYWLFKYRLKNSDKAKVASDTQKGLEQLKRMGAGSRPEAQSAADT